MSMKDKKKLVAEKGGGKEETVEKDKQPVKIATKKGNIKGNSTERME